MGTLATGDDAPAKAAATIADPRQEAADTMYPTTRASAGPSDEAPAAVKTDPTPTAMRSTLDQNETKLADRAGLKLEALATERREFAAMLYDTGLHPYVGVAELLHTAWTDARLAETQPERDEAAESTARATANQAIREELRQRYGRRDAEEYLERVQKFVKAHPKLNAIVTTGGVGSRADVVNALIDHVRAVNFR